MKRAAGFGMVGRAGGVMLHVAPDVRRTTPEPIIR